MQERVTVHEWEGFRLSYICLVKLYEFRKILNLATPCESITLKLGEFVGEFQELNNLLRLQVTGRYATGSFPIYVYLAVFSLRRLFFFKARHASMYKLSFLFNT
jgi:hypothetical protein